MPISLTHRPAPAKRGKHRTNTPIVFALTREHKGLIQKPPRRSFARCKELQGDSTDWYNLMFRNYSGYQISLVEYEEETQRSFKEVVDVLLAVKDKALKLPTQQWEYSRADLDIIESGLDAMDMIDDQVTRRVQLDCLLKTKAYLQQFLKVS